MFIQDLSFLGNLSDQEQKVVAGGAAGQCNLSPKDGRYFGQGSLSLSDDEVFDPKPQSQRPEELQKLGLYVSFCAQN